MKNLLLKISFRHLGLPRLGLLIIYVIAVCSAPYHFAETNNGRYLTVTLQQIDPTLFPNDPVVSAMSLLFSAYYSALGKLIASPDWLFFLAPLLSGLCKALAVAASWWTGKALDESSWLSLLLAAWAAHDKTPYYGAVSLFMPTVTHHEWGVVLAIFAVGFILRGKIIPGYLILGATVFVHVIVALHFGLCLLPFLWFHGRKQGWLPSVIALTIFALCSLLYVLALAPPPLTATDAEIFYQAESTSRHFNPWARYGVMRIVLLSNLLLLTGASAVYFRNRLGSVKHLCDLLLSGIGIGVIAALGGSFLAMRGIVTVALFQPLRLFIPIAFFCFVLLWLFTVKVFRENNAAVLPGICIAANLFFIAFDQNWGLLFTLPCLLWYAIHYLKKAQGLTKLLHQSAKVFTVILLIFISAAGLAGARLPFASLRSLTFLLPGLIALAALLVKGNTRRWLGCGAIVALFYALTLLTLDRHRVYAQSYDADWIAVRQWCRENTPMQARFITPPYQLNFRTLSLRTTMSEFTSQLAWVKPAVYRENVAASQLAARAYTPTQSDATYLLDLAQQWHCDYVITQGEVTAHQGKVVWRAGPYQVIQRVNQTPQTITP